MFHSMRREWPVIGHLLLAVALFTQFVYAAQACLLPQSALWPPSRVAALANCEGQPGSAGVRCNDPDPESEIACLANLTRGDQSAASVFKAPAFAESDAAVRFTALSDIAPSCTASPAELRPRFSGPPLPILFCRFQT